jgi:hypothetical protein
MLISVDTWSCAQGSLPEGPFGVVVDHRVDGVHGVRPEKHTKKKKKKKEFLQRICGVSVDTDLRRAFGQVKTKVKLASGQPLWIEGVRGPMFLISF